MFVIARKYGQLGNRLCRAAHLMAAALEEGHGFADLAFAEYAALFEDTRRDVLCRYPRCRLALPAPRRIRKLVAKLLLGAARAASALGPRLRWVKWVRWSDEDADYRLDGPELAALAKGSRVLLFEGWRFRTGAVARHAAAIRAHFMPAREYLARIEARAAALRAGCDVLVGVHVRRGDYATFLGGRYHWPVSAYAELMRRVEALFPGRKVRFAVCSNEPLDPAAFGELACELVAEEAIVDLYTLARCDYVMGPLSTFTLWASFHGNVPLWVIERPDETPALADFVPRGV